MLTWRREGFKKVRKYVDVIYVFLFFLALIVKNTANVCSTHFSSQVHWHYLWWPSYVGIFLPSVNVNVNLTTFAHFSISVDNQKSMTILVCLFERLQDFLFKSKNDKGSLVSVFSNWTLKKVNNQIVLCIKGDLLNFTYCFKNFYWL